MKLTNIFNADDRGVSPVIGVILMVAITVILAAVIGTFVLGLGNQVGNNAPQATFDYQYSGFSDSSGTDWVNVTHQSGAQIDPANVNISVGDETAATDGSANDTNLQVVNAWSNPVSAGDTLRANNSSNALPNNADVRLVWQSDGGSSSIISSSTTPN